MSNFKNLLWTAGAVVVGIMVAKMLGVESKTPTVL